jgi:hypothetical protein
MSSRSTDESQYIVVIAVAFDKTVDRRTHN